MHYLVSFALGLQSRVLIPIVDRLKLVFFYAFKHPIKTFFYLIKLYIMLLLFMSATLFFVGSVSAQSIWEMSTSHTPSQSGVCMKTGDSAGRTMQEYLDDLYGAQESQQCDGVTIGLCYGNYTKSTNVIEDGTSCRGTAEVSWVRQKYHPSLGYYSQVPFETEVDASGYLELEETCPPSSNPMATFMRNGACYDINEVEDNDSCDIGEPDLLGTSDGPDLVCQTKADGSKCAMKKYEVNGQYAYTQNLEPSACLTGENNLPDYENSNFPPTVNNGECQNIGNGVEACPADPNQVCDAVTGTCETGCGSFQIGATATFMCLKDIQNDCNPVTETCPIEPTEPPVCDDPLGCEEPPVCDNPLGCDGEGNANETDLTPLIDAQNNTTQAVVNTTNAVKALGSGLSQLNQTGSAQLGELRAIKDELKSTAAPVNFNDPTALYTPNDYQQKNFGTVLSAAVTEMQNAEISKAINSFFDVSLSGACPTYTADIPYIGTSITIDQFCGSVMNSIWPIISTIILLVFSVLAFRVAIL